VIWFDPSYGKRYTGKTDDEIKKAFQSRAISFIGTLGPVAGRPTVERVRFTEITPNTPLLITVSTVKR
jgi:hypothetical protein